MPFCLKMKIKKTFIQTQLKGSNLCQLACDLHHLAINKLIKAHLLDSHLSTHMSKEISYRLCCGQSFVCLPKKCLCIIFRIVIVCTKYFIKRLYFAMKEILWNVIHTTNILNQVPYKLKCVWSKCLQNLLNQLAFM